MSLNHSLTCYRQTSIADSDRWSTPSVEREAPTKTSALTTPIRTDSLFANLLFNREQVYSYQAVPIKEEAPSADDTTVECRTNSGNTIESRAAVFAKDKMPPKSIAKNNTKTVSKRRGRPPKTSITKSKEKAEEPKSRKRAATKTVSELDKRPAQAPRMDSKANIGKKVGSSGGNGTNSTNGILTLTRPPEHEVIEVSSDSDNDTDTEEPVAKRRGRQPSEKAQATRPRSQANRAPIADTFTRPSIPGAWEATKADTPDSVLDLAPVSNEEVLQENNVEGLRRELRAKQVCIEKLQQEMEKKHGDYQLEKYRMEERHRQELAKLLRDFETERTTDRAIDAERDDLIKKLQQPVSARDTTQSQHESKLQVIQTQYENEKQAHTRLQDLVLMNATQHQQDIQTLQAQIEEEKRAHQNDQKCHDEIVSDILKSQPSKSDPRIAELETANASLAQEVESLKAAVKTSRSQPTLSPVPSQASSDEEKREDNVRKMYIKTKRQYDIMHSVAQNLVSCTRSMDLSIFGEFGVYMKKLRGCLEGNGGGKQGNGGSRAVVLKKEERRR